MPVEPSAAAAAVAKPRTPADAAASCQVKVNREQRRRVWVDLIRERGKDLSMVQETPPYHQLQKDTHAQAANVVASQIGSNCCIDRVRFFFVPRRASAEQCSKDVLGRMKSYTIQTKLWLYFIAHVAVTHSAFKFISNRGRPFLKEYLEKLKLRVL